MDLDAWLTTTRVRRAAALLLIVPARSDACSWGELVRAGFRRAGGSFEEIEQLIELLNSLDLTESTGERFSRSTKGERLARRLGDGRDLTPFALALLRGGCFSSQARRLFEAGDLLEDGSLTCQVSVARRSAPQLVGVLELWSSTETSPRLMISQELVTHLRSLWSWLPREPQSPPWVIERLAVGDRAEAYSVEYERSRAADPTAIVWVARESDALGWDVEDRSLDALRRIEVKGSRDKRVVFFLTANEMRQAKSHGESYELQFWGEIALSREPMEEYRLLRQRGYPHVYANIGQLIDGPGWNVQATEWKISSGEGERPGAPDIVPLPAEGS